MLLHCRERFWESEYGIFGGASVSDHIIRQIYYPSGAAVAKVYARPAVHRYMSLYSGYITGEFGPAHASEPDATVTVEQEHERGPGVLLGSYTWGEDARRLGALSPDDRAAVVKPRLPAFTPRSTRR